MTSFGSRMKGAILCALFVLVVALVALVGSMVRLIHTVDQTVAALPQQFDRQITETRNAALLAIINGKRDTLAEVANIRRDLFAQVKDLSAAANGQITDIRVTVDKRLGEALGEVADLSEKLDPVLANVTTTTENVSSITAHVADALPSFTDCAYTDESGNPVGGNPDCAFNRFQGVSKAVEQMARAGAKAAPEVSSAVVGIAKSADGIADDAHTFTSDLVKPRTTWQKIKAWLETAGKIGARFL